VGEGDDGVVADVADGRAEDQALLVGRERGGGEVRHAHRRVEVGEEVNRKCAVRPQRRRALRDVKATAPSVDFR
jgi:hypothetical protein